MTGRLRVRSRESCQQAPKTQTAASSRSECLMVALRSSNSASKSMHLGCRAVVDWKMQPATKGEKGSPTDMGYPVYPPSLYRQTLILTLILTLACVALRA